MKKTIAKVMTFTMLAATLAGCGHSNSVSTESMAAPEKIQTEGTASEVAKTKEEGAGVASYEFAFPPSTQSNTFQATMNDTFKEFCNKKGYGYVCLSPDYDLNTQLSQMADVVIQSFDTVFVIPTNSARIRQGLEQIHEKNILTLNADTPVIDDDLDLVEIATITDTYNAGTLAGQQMVANYPGGARTAILDFLSNEPCVSRVAGLLDGLGDTKNKFDIAAQQDDMAVLSISMSITENITRANPDLNASFCINDPSALGVAAAIRASGKVEIGVHSIDASPDSKAAILDGSFTAVTVQVPIGIAEVASEKAEESLADGEIEKEILLLFFLVDEEEAEVILRDWR